VDDGALLLLKNTFFLCASFARKYFHFNFLK
jgi:hypothetical protein